MPFDNAPPTRKTGRRAVLISGAVALAGGAGIFASRWFNTGAEIGAGALSVGQAHRQAMAGEILLVDIRRPDEWARTGIGAGAQPLDMRREDFAQALLALTGGDRDAPIALICARGVRSRKLTRRLSEAGFTNVLDVPEGMLGSGAGPGWLRAGLPVVRP